MSISISDSVLRPLEQWYSELNSTTLHGALDVVVVRDPVTGNLVSSPFHVRFGKLGVLKANEKTVDVEVNDRPVIFANMKLDDRGVAYFTGGGGNQKAVVVASRSSSRRHRRSLSDKAKKMLAEKTSDLLQKGATKDNLAGELLQSQLGDRVIKYVQDKQQQPSVNGAAALEFQPDRKSSAEEQRLWDWLGDDADERSLLRPDPAVLEGLNLVKGRNRVTFKVTTALQGTARCRCYIYYWEATDKLVISDIDGTITKSDVLGQLLPLLGRDWAQLGVASLLSRVAARGYKIVYLSARAIGQASLTKELLANVRQLCDWQEEGVVGLPDGPVFLNPTSLAGAFHREVVEKRPEVFKIACLRDLGRLFYNSSSPFYAGYGNRPNDAVAYRAVGVPDSRIFTVNSKGELRGSRCITHESCDVINQDCSQLTYLTSYSAQCGDDLDLLYPSLVSADRNDRSSSSFSKPCKLSEEETRRMRANEVIRQLLPDAMSCYGDKVLGVPTDMLLLKRSTSNLIRKAKGECAGAALEVVKTSGASNHN